ncbi:unnamed protein product, partial [Citrullus colocynthis]
MEECWFLKVTDEFLNVQELLEQIVKDDDSKEEDDIQEEEEQLALAAAAAAFKESRSHVDVIFPLRKYGDIVPDADVTE